MSSSNKPYQYLPIEGTPTLQVEGGNGILRINFRELWAYRELLYFLMWRELKVRYKQTAIGAAWAIIQPVLTMIIFAVIFGNFAQIPSDESAYPVFVYAALLPWTYFSQAVERASSSMVENARLITKVYFPRLVIPIAALLTPLVDLMLALIVIIPLMLIYQVMPTLRILTLPLFMLIAILTAMSISLWFAALNVRYRDIRYVIPFILQVGLYATPVVYPLSIVPERWQALYSLNPMVAVISGFRWALLGQGELNVLSTTIGLIAVLILTIGGLYYFRYVERTFADVI